MLSVTLFYSSVFHRSTLSDNLIKVTDGRRAEVEFTKDWNIDANRNIIHYNQKPLIFFWMYKRTILKTEAIANNINIKESVKISNKKSNKFWHLQ